MKKWLKRFCQNFFCHSRTGVGDRNHDVVTGRRFFRLFGRADCRIRRFDSDIAAIFHGIARVDHEIENNQLYLCRIGKSLPASRSEYSADTNAAAQRALQQIVHILQRFVNVERLRLQPLAAGEREQLGCEFGPALGRQSHMRKPLLQFRIADTGTGSFQKTNVSEHDCEQVIEVVCDT